MTDQMLDPNTPVGIDWDPRFQPLLDALNKRLEQPFRSNTHLTARCLLAFLKAGHTNLTIKDIVDGVYDNDRPKGGWVMFDRVKWYNYVPRIVQKLRTDLPKQLALAEAGKPLFF